MFRKTLSKGYWLTIGILLFLLGIIGALLPIMPGFIFFGLSGLAFMRCSTRFDAWVRRQHWIIRLRERFRQFRNPWC